MRSSRLIPRILTGVLALTCFGFVPHRFSEVYMRAYGPHTEVHIVRPVIGWEIWPGQGSEISSVDMTVDGHRVNAKYDASSRFMYYTPEGPIAPGTHQVKC